MKKHALSIVVALVALCFLTGSIAHAGTLTIPFPAPGNYYCTSIGPPPGCGFLGPPGSQTPDMSTAGDFIQSALVTSTLSGVTGLTGSFQYTDDLGGGNNELVYVEVNGTPVADFTALDCNYCGSVITVPVTATFADIAPVNGGYQLAMVLQNTIPSSGGWIAFNDPPGEWTLTGTSSTPEPSSLIMFGSGVVAFASALGRKLAGGPR